MNWGEISNSKLYAAPNIIHREIVVSLVYEKKALFFQSSKIDLIPVLESLEYILSGSTCFQNANVLLECGCEVTKGIHGN